MDVQSIVGTTPQETDATASAAAADAQNAAAASQGKVSVQPSAAGDGPQYVSTLKEPIQQLFGGGSNLEITFRVEHDPDMIVTVFRDSNTGREIAQFPPEVMVQIAQFFQKLAGAVVDRSA